MYGPELDGTNDSKADLIAAILRQEGVAPGAALMIGDRSMDMTAAVRNAMAALGVTWGYGSAEELSGAGAAALCHRPDGLAGAVGALLPKRR